jgi:phenylpyruvate tautomerase PptA (4-oxalocrotonate tautomerase family)
MPVITVTLIEGYDAVTRRRLSERLTDAALATIAAPVEGVTVIVNEVAPASYMRGRSAKTPGPAPTPPAEVCLAFLDAVGRRDLAAAVALTGEGFTMTFPGGARFTDFGQLLDWAAPRYRRIAKTIERVEEAPLGVRVAVHVSGTLSGEWPDGAAFAGIRFIDRFEVERGLIHSQEVWNDLAQPAANP